jgi:hypothetical protein
MNPLDCEIISEQETSARILELREKILDENYINGAIQRIALILSRQLVEKPKNLKEAVNGS